jgi:hypothetical protein
MRCLPRVVPLFILLYIPLEALVHIPILELLWPAGLIQEVLSFQALDGKVLQIMHQ